MRAAARRHGRARDRAGPGRRDRAAAAAQHRLRRGRCRPLAISPSSPSRIRSRRRCSTGRRARRIGFSRIVSLGESADVELGDILDYLALDLATRAILVHLEGIADARRFMSAARAAARIKPVIVLKAGRQIGPPAERGRSASASGCTATGSTTRRSAAPASSASTRSRSCSRLPPASAPTPPAAATACATAGWRC